jgi:hypothetical protein
MTQSGMLWGCRRRGGLALLLLAALGAPRGEGFVVPPGRAPAARASATRVGAGPLPPILSWLGGKGGKEEGDDKKALAKQPTAKAQPPRSSILRAAPRAAPQGPLRVGQAKPPLKPTGPQTTASKKGPQTAGARKAGEPAPAPAEGKPLGRFREGLGALTARLQTPVPDVGGVLGEGANCC